MEILELKINGFVNGERIPQKFAFGVPTDEELFTFGPNISPALSWSEGPEGTMSYAVIMHDASVPTVFDDANQEGKTISADLPRMDFYHWVLVDVPKTITELVEGAESNSVVAKGKPIGKSDYGIRGANDFGMFISPNEMMLNDVLRMCFEAVTVF